MYHGKNISQYLQHIRSNKKVGALFLSALLLATMVIGGTVAYLFSITSPVENTFTPSHVSCEVKENFNGTTKSNVNVKNTGDIDAYIRVKLVTYRVNAQGQHIGGTADIPTFTPGEKWVKHGEYYYYTLPVKPTEKPAADLISSIDLIDSYTDADGGKQVIEVMAEAIQADGVAADGTTKAVKDAWSVDPEELNKKVS